MRGLIEQEETIASQSPKLLAITAAAAIARFLIFLSCATPWATQSAPSLVGGAGVSPVGYPHLGVNDAGWLVLYSGSVQE